MSQSEFEYLTGPIILPLLYLEFSEIQEVSLGDSIHTELCYHPLINFACTLTIAVSELEFGYF